MAKKGCFLDQSVRLLFPFWFLKSVHLSQIVDKKKDLVCPQRAVKTNITL